jgi:hypothetical protein
LWLAFYLRQADTSGQHEKVGLLVIPGLGRIDRLATVLDNVAKLRSRLQTDWDCVVYVYADRAVELEFWSQKTSLATLARHCTLVEHPNKRVTENLFLVQPYLLARSSYRYIFLLLDDCQLEPSSTDPGDEFDLAGLLRVMDTNSLTLASPRVSTVDCEFDLLNIVILVFIGFFLFGFHSNSV